MSNDAADSDVRAWERLELAARRLMQEHTALRRRLSDAERRVAELERALEQVSGGDIDPVALQTRLGEATTENEALRERLAEAQARVQRLLARLQFLHEAQ